MAKAVPTENFTRELKRFERAIDVIDREQPDLTDKQVIEVLISRDALQHLLENDIEETCEEIAQLHVLDEQLQTLGSTIAANADMENLRITLSRPDAYWWWAFEPPTDAWDKLDWLWNTLSIVLLALAASFMFSIYSAFSAGDATVATAFSMIIQLVGLASEMYEGGQLTNAEQAYIQGLAIDPDQLEFHHKLGQVYESLGELQPAFEHYLIGSEAGSPSTLNDLGRVAINHYDPVSQETDVALATAYLLLGLQRAETDLDTPPYTYYQLNKNIGWTLIEQEKYDKAIPYLVTV